MFVDVNPEQRKAVLKLRDLVDEWGQDVIRVFSILMLLPEPVRVDILENIRVLDPVLIQQNQTIKKGQRRFKMDEVVLLISNIMWLYEKDNSES
jgi:hypothetical protein